MTSFLKSFSYAFSGLRMCMIKEANFKIHILSTVIVTTAGWYFNISKTEWALIIICTGFVLSMELLNTAIEQLCNFIHLAPSPVIKIIKDVAAGAVLVSAMVAIVCGAIIFLPKIFI